MCENGYSAYHRKAFRGWKRTLVVGPCLPPCVRQVLLFPDVNDRLVGPRASWDSPISASHLTLGVLVLQTCTTASVFRWALRIWTQVLMFVWQELYSQSHLPGSCIRAIWNVSGVLILVLIYVWSSFIYNIHKYKYILYNINIYMYTIIHYEIYSCL